ncbi:MAG: hypothetical protein ACK455_08180, partial [Bacteroidota bacterium]
SLYDSDLFLVFENGILVTQYEVDNNAEFQNRLKQKEQMQKERLAEERMINFLAITVIILVFIGICIGIFYLIKWGTLLGYLISAILASGVIFQFVLSIRTSIKNKKK